MKNGLVTSAKIIRVIDADTLEVEIVRRFPVRLVDTDSKGRFNSPELSTEEGQKAKEFVKSIIENKEIQIFIPSNNGLQLTDINSFNRILGEILIDGEKLTDILIKEGYGEIT